MFINTIFSNLIMDDNNLCISFEDLYCIDTDAKKIIRSCLDDLMTFEYDNYLMQVITGYNWYNKTFNESDNIIYISHIHEDEAYKKEVISGLKFIGFDDTLVKRCIRNKGGRFVPDVKTFRIRNDSSEIYKGLKIKDTRTDNDINLENYTEPLGNYPEFDDAQGYLISEDYGWELNLPIENDNNLLKTIELFSSKSFREREGIINKNAWAGAYRIPVLILSKKALEYKMELPDFTVVTKLVLKAENNEISFIINKNFKLLENLPHFQQLIDLGFKKEVCLANNVFIKEYIDYLEPIIINRKLKINERY